MFQWNSHFLTKGYQWVSFFEGTCLVELKDNQEENHLCWGPQTKHPSEHLEKPPIFGRVPSSFRPGNVPNLKKEPLNISVFHFIPPPSHSPPPPALLQLKPGSKLLWKRKDPQKAIRSQAGRKKRPRTTIWNLRRGFDRGLLCRLAGPGLGSPAKRAVVC